MRMTLNEFLTKIKESPIELMGVIFHSTTGIKDFRIIGEGTETRVGFNFSSIAQGIVDNKTSMITLVHNHPAGHEVRPSREDLDLTFKLQDRLKKVNIKIHDHLILGGAGGVYSFADNKVI